VPRLVFARLGFEAHLSLVAKQHQSARRLSARSLAGLHQND